MKRNELNNTMVILQENKYLYDLDVAQQSKYISIENIRIVM